MNGRMNEWTISPFYRTSSPIKAAALPPPMKVEQGKGTADHLMPLGYLFLIFLLIFFSFKMPLYKKLFPSVRKSVRLLFCLSVCRSDTSFSKLM